MPIFIALLALALLGFLGLSFGNTEKASKKNSLNEARLKTIEEQLTSTRNSIQEIEKRILNIEDIVTDVKFEEVPATGREAINLKVEMSELKAMISSLKK